MAISFVGAASGTNSASLTGTGRQAGDLILVFAYRDGNATAPTLGSGYTNIANVGANSNSERTGWRISDGTETSTGTWTNATTVIALVYRGALQSGPIGATAAAGAASTTVSYPALSGMAAGGSWVVGLAGHRSTNTSLETPPTGMVLRQNAVDATDEASGFDTNGAVTSWSLRTVSVGGSSSGWRGRTVEILAEPDPIALDWTATPEGTGAFRIEVADLPGAVDTLQYRLDGGSWTTFATDLADDLPENAMVLLTDAFPGSSLDSGKWTAGGTVTVSGGFASMAMLTSYGNFFTSVSTNRNLTGNELRARLSFDGTPPANGELLMATTLNATNRARFGWMEGNIYAAINQNSATATVLRNNVAYNASTHVYFRIREAGGTLYYEWSTNGADWTEYTTATPVFAVTSLQAIFSCGNWNANSGTARVSEVNT